MQEAMLPTTSGGYRRFNLEDILFLQAAGNYSTLHKVHGNPIVLSVLLKEVEEKLTRKGFYRLSRSCIINLGHVVEYRPGQDSNVLLSDGTTIEIPRRKKKAFKELMKQRYMHL